MQIKAHTPKSSIGNNPGIAGTGIDTLQTRVGIQRHYRFN